MTDRPDPIERLEVGRRLNDLKMRILWVPETRFGLLTCGFKSNPCPLIIPRQSSRGRRAGPAAATRGWHPPDHGRTGDTAREAPGI